MADEAISENKKNPRRQMAMGIVLLSVRKQKNRQSVYPTLTAF